MEGKSWVLLGEIALKSGAGIQRISGRRQRAVGALLALDAPNSVSTERLIDELWPDEPPEGARNSVQRFVSDLRRALGDDAHQLESSAGGYRLGTAVVDLREVESLVDTARAAAAAGDHTDAIDRFEQALAMWTGRPLAGIGTPDFAVGASAAITELRLQAVEECAASRLALDDHRAALASLERETTANPHREQLWLLLAEAQSMSGLRREAATSLRTHRAHLADVGLEPSKAVADLERMVFADDPDIADLSNTTTAQATAAPTSDRLIHARLPVVLDRTLGTTMTGHTAPLDELRLRLEKASNGEPDLVFVSGDPGLGKTRVAAELAAEAHADGWAVRYGRSSEALSVSYEAWIDALTDIVRQASDDLIHEHVVTHGTALFSLLPGLARRAPDTQPDAEADAETVRLRVFDAVTDLLIESCAHQPTLLILDDLQWATPTSCALLDHLGDRLDGRLLVIATFRDGEVAADAPLRDAMVSTATGGAHHRIELSGLGESDIETLIQAHGASDDPNTTASELLERTGGNPLFVVEVLRDRAERDHAPSEVPTTVQRVIERRAARLGDDAVRTLRAAAVRGRVFSVEQLKSMTSSTIDDVLDVLDAATASKLVIEIDGEDEVFAFAHDLIPAALIAGLSTSRRQRLHVAAADALESTGGRRSSEVSDVAQHLIRAGSSVERQRVFDACLAAARDARARFATAEACQWFDAALEHVDDEIATAQVWVERAVQQRIAGNIEYREWLGRAGDVARRVGADELLIDAACADPGPTAASLYVDAPERRERTQAALDVCVEGDSVARANLLASLATQLFGPEHRNERVRLRGEAVAMARRLGDPVTLANALLRMARSATDPLPLDEQAALHDEVAEILARSDVDEPLLDFDLARSRLAVAYRIGDGSACAALVDQAVERAERFPIPINRLGALHCQTLQASVHADLPRFEQLNNDAFALGTSIGAEESPIVFQTHLIYLWSMQGKNADVAPLIEAWMAEDPDSTTRKSAAAYVFCEAGRFDQAKALVDEAARSDFDVPDTAQHGQNLNSWGLSAWMVGDEPAVLSIYDRLLPHRHLMASYVNHVIQQTAMTTMNLATRLGRWDEALDHFELAGRLADDLNARWMRTAADQSHAELLIRRNESGDADAARSISERVISIAGEHGYGGLVQRAQHLLSSNAVGQACGLPGNAFRTLPDQSAETRSS
ncbi:MAG: BTAD domain-containing putative transcriptional regulator [Ilumatobacter sp.]